jgi:hypothetical protein
MSWAARTGGLRAFGIPAWFRYGTVRMSKLLSKRGSILAYPSLGEFLLGWGSSLLTGGRVVPKNSGSRTVKYCFPQYDYH